MLKRTAQVVSINVLSLLRSTPPLAFLQLLLIAAYSLRKAVTLALGLYRSISCQKSISSSKDVKDRSCSPVNFFLSWLSKTAFSSLTCISAGFLVRAATGS